MELSQEKLERYQKSLRALREVTDELLSHMKGRDWSFQRLITDRNGEFSQEKLRAFVEELMSLWTEKVREGTDTDPATGESLAEPWLQERRELYGLYLYLVMRCSLERGAYSDARNGADVKERTDFAFLLEQARQLSRDWCVMAKPDGTCCNELYWGYDAYFGFHLYYTLNDPDVRNSGFCPGNDWSLTPDWRRACQEHDCRLTNDGNMKRLYLKHSLWSSKAEGPKEAPEAEEEAPDEEGEALVLPDEEDEPVEDGYDPLEDDDWYPFPSAEAYYEFQVAGWETRSEEDGRAYRQSVLAMRFQCSEEYRSACERFAELFQNARPEVLRDFYTNLEEIVDLYLAAKEIAPLTDTDKALNVYSRVYDSALQQARRYGRGLKWEAL